MVSANVLSTQTVQTFPRALCASHEGRPRERRLVAPHTRPLESNLRATAEHAYGGNAGCPRDNVHQGHLEHFSGKDKI